MIHSVFTQCMFGQLPRNTGLLLHCCIQSFFCKRGKIGQATIVAYPLLPPIDCIGLSARIIDDQKLNTTVQLHVADCIRLAVMYQRLMTEPASCSPECSGLGALLPGLLLVPGQPEEEP